MAVTGTARIVAPKEIFFVGLSVGLELADVDVDTKHFEVGVTASLGKPLIEFAAAIGSLRFSSVLI